MGRSAVATAWLATEHQQLMYLLSPEGKTVFYIPGVEVVHKVSTPINLPDEASKIKRRLGEELRRIFREELEGKTEDMLKEKQEEQDKEEEKERSRQQARRKDEGEEEFEQNSLETIPPLSTAGRLMAPQITIRKRLALPLYSNEVDESRRGERERQESEERDGEKQQEAEARSDVDEEEERQKYFRRLWSLRQARVSARLKKGRNGAHQNVQKKHQHHHQRRYQRQNGQKKQKYDTGPRRIVQNSLESRFLA